MVTVLAALAVALAAPPPSNPTGCTLGDPAARPARRTILPEDLVRLRDIGGFDSSLMKQPSPLAVSPDGKTVAFVLSQADPDANRYCRWLIETPIEPDAQPRILDQGGDAITMRADVRGSMVEVGYPETIVPAWSPGGRAIGYLRRDGGVTQLWVAGRGERKPAPVTASPVDIEAWA